MSISGRFHPTAPPPVSVISHCIFLSFLCNQRGKKEERWVTALTPSHNKKKLYYWHSDWQLRAARIWGVTHLRHSLPRQQELQEESATCRRWRLFTSFLTLARIVLMSLFLFDFFPPGRSVGRWRGCWLPCNDCCLCNFVLLQREMKPAWWTVWWRPCSPAQPSAIAGNAHRETVRA